MPVAKLKSYLDSNHIKYVSVAHSRAYTAQGIAALTHTPGKEFAKTVVVKLDGRLALAVLPASAQIDVMRLMKVSGAEDVEIAHERDFKDQFPGCELGAMPPFGNLYGMPVFVDQALTDDREIAFNAGSHFEMLRLSFDDFNRLVRPTIARFAAKARAHVA